MRIDAMEARLAAGAAVVAIVIVAIALLALNTMPAPPAMTATTTVASGQQRGQGTQPFSSSPYYQNAYLISGNTTLSASGQAATSDFSLAVNDLGNGTAVYTLVFVDTGAEYNVTLTSGQSLYYIDSNLGDDSPTADSFHLDDGYVVVDANGYIVSQSYPLS